MPTNWFGLEFHPTDEYIDWRDRNRVEKAEKLRAAYDKIIELGLKDELNLLTQAAYEKGKFDEFDSNSDQ